jgi:glycosyltransferase involved in cell wall biosynthesis
MRRNAESIDLFLSPGDSYADLMADLLQVGRERFRTVRAGIFTAEHRRPGPRVREPFTLGYLSVICRPKGLDILVDAWRKLVGEGREVVLRVAGRVMDPRYWRQVERSITATRGGRFEILGEVDFPGKISFLHSCSAFSVPSRQRETRGMAVLEALAAGVPVVAPDAGVYPEMLSLAPGGILVPGENPDALAAALARLMDDPDEADALGEAGARGVAENHEASVVVDAMLAALDEVRARKPDQQVS